MSKVSDGDGEPRAVVHKRILDIAEQQPDASLTELAAEVSAATPDLVEKVLAEYGDPSDTDAESTMSENGQRAPEMDGSIEEEDEQAEYPTDLTQKQLETVSVVHEHPEASQGVVAERLGVSRATVSRRLNDIPGFEWADRQAFTSNLFDSTDLTPSVPAQPAATETADQGSRESGADGDGDSESDNRESGDSESGNSEGGDTRDQGDSGDQGRGGAEETLADIEERVTAVEGRLETVSEEVDDSGEEPALRPELAHKVVHAAMESGRIDEEEELELIAALLDR